jgi:hypothetical protein
VTQNISTAESPGRCASPMARTFFSILSLLFWVINAFCQKDFSTIDKSLIKLVANKIETERSCKGNLVLDLAPLEQPSFQYLNGFKEFDSILQDLDSISMKIQNVKVSALKWDSSLIDKATFITKEDFQPTSKRRSWEWWESFYKRYNGGYHQMSVPLFTNDFEYCFVIFWQKCWRLDGVGQIIVYKKENHEWILYAKIQTWIS